MELGYDAATATSPAVEGSMNLTDKSGSDKAYHAVPLPLSGNFLPAKPGLNFIDEIIRKQVNTARPKAMVNAVRELIGGKIQSGNGWVHQEGLRLHDWQGQPRDKIGRFSKITTEVNAYREVLYADCEDYNGTLNAD
ncbi:hypothetical protein Tco_0356955 [Tanacetum coccineum]